MSVDRPPTRPLPDALQFAERMGNLPLFLAIQRGFALVLPLIMIGALALMVRYFPIPAFQGWLAGAFAGHWQIALDNIVSGSFGIASLAVLCAFSGTLTSLFNQRHKGQFVSPIMAAIVVLSCFFVFVAPADAASWRLVLSMNRGLLVALAVAAVASSLFLRLSQYSALQLPLGVVGNDPVVRDVLTVMPAGMITILVFAMGRMVLSLTGTTDVHGIVGNLLTGPFADSGDGLGFAVGYVSLSQLLWFFGAHGPNLLFAVEENILAPAAVANAQAFVAGTDLPYTVTKTFIDVFTRMGGSGCTLCLIAAILIWSRDGGIRKLCLFALFPALSNVNEPMLFGIPLVLNPTYVIPFLLTPVVQTLAAYGATALDLLPRTVAEIPWTTPVLVSGFTATDSLAGAIMQMANLVLGIAIYRPFVRLADHLREHQSKRLLNDLLSIAESLHTVSGQRKCLDRPGELGRVAKALANDLEVALASSDQLFLEFQPQVDVKRNRIQGVEALLRWEHPSYGRIPPPLTVALAEDLESIDALGMLVLGEACRQRAQWQTSVPDDLVISVNVSPQQLVNPLFATKVLAAVSASGLKPTQLELEITETLVVEPDARSIETLRKLRKEGVRVAIDDFGMGHTSLRYIREFPVDTIKIDRSLTLMSVENVNEQIVNSILALSRSLNINAVVEGIERRDQLSRFLELGCETFQGYLFSKPVSGEECLAFVLGSMCEDPNRAPKENQETHPIPDP